MALQLVSEPSTEARTGSVAFEGDTPARQLRLELIALGPVLALWPEALDRETAAVAVPRALEHAAARRALVPRVGVRSDAIIEELVALGVDARAHVRLVRLPDSDYYGWECACRRARASLDGASRRAARVGVGGSLTRYACPAPRWRGALASLVGEADALALAWSSRCSVAALRVIEALRRGDEIRLDDSSGAAGR